MLRCFVWEEKEEMADMYLVGRRESVYPPAEDSFALADAVRKDLGDGILEERPTTSGCARSRVVVEVGSGSGYVLCSVVRCSGSRHESSRSVDRSVYVMGL